MNNSDQIQYWNAKPGQQWTLYQHALDTLFQNVSHRILEMSGIMPGVSVLDVGCGTGSLSLDLANAVGESGHVDAIDVSESMLNLARQRAIDANYSNIEYLIADAQVFDFAPNRYELIVSRFGVMFFDDPVAAFRNLRRSLKPEAMTIFAAWSDMENNPWFKIPYDVTIDRLGEATPLSQTAPSFPPPPGPTAFADRNYVSRMLERAGYASINSTLETVPLIVAGNANDAALLGCSLGPVVRIAKEKGATDGDLHAIRQEVSRQFEQYGSDSQVVVPAKINFFKCKNNLR